MQNEEKNASASDSSSDESAAEKVKNVPLWNIDGKSIEDYTKVSSTIYRIVWWNSTVFFFVSIGRICHNCRSNKSHEWISNRLIQIIVFRLSSIRKCH